MLRWHPKLPSMMRSCCCCRRHRPPLPDLLRQVLARKRQHASRDAVRGCCETKPFVRPPHLMLSAFEFPLPKCDNAHGRLTTDTVFRCLPELSVTTGRVPDAAPSARRPLESATNSLLRVPRGPLSAYLGIRRRTALDAAPS